jgi:hypothetical protein
VESLSPPGAVDPACASPPIGLKLIFTTGAPSTGSLPGSA